MALGQQGTFTEKDLQRIHQAGFKEEDKGNY